MGGLSTNVITNDGRHATTSNDVAANDAKTNDATTHDVAANDAITNGHDATTNDAITNDAKTNDATANDGRHDATSNDGWRYDDGWLLIIFFFIHYNHNYHKELLIGYPNNKI